MQLLSSTGTPGYNGAWDILSAGWGLSIPVDWIDTASFENLFDVFTGNLLDREYIFTEPFVMREFLEQECKLLGWNLTVINGKLTAVAYESPTLANSVLTIDDTIRTSEGQESNGGQWVHAPEQLINRITLKGAYDLVEDEFRIDTTYGNAVGQLDAGVTNGLAIECTGLGNKFMRAAETFEAKLSSVIAGLVARMFELSQQTYNYTCTCNDLIDNLTPGQIVDVTDSYVPNPLTNTRGITRSVGRVIEVAYNELEGTGTITVRLSYPYVNTLSSVTTTEWNKGNLAPALWMDGIAADNLTIDVSEGYFGGTTSGPAQWAAGDAVQLREVNNPTAQVITGTVSSVVEDGATRRIILSGAATITGSQYTVSPVAFSEADSTKGSFIAGDTGLLSSATVLGTGYKW